MTFWLQGLATGVVILLISNGKSSHLLVFSEDLFFIYLLPPIIFNAGSVSFASILIFLIIYEFSLVWFCAIEEDFSDWYMNNQHENYSKRYFTTKLVLEKQALCDS